MDRQLGLDVGDKTIGIAVSDELGLTAQGVTVRARQT
jgi:putative holliday junction resolvase